jgi:S-adenosylmethionine decarboxylase
LSHQYKEFSPQGITLLYLLSESHLSFHSYPEKGFVAIDCYTCGETVDPNVAINIIVNELNPEIIYKKCLTRGVGEIVIE